MEAEARHHSTTTWRANQTPTLYFDYFKTLVEDFLGIFQGQLYDAGDSFTLMLFEKEKYPWKSG